MKIIIERIDKYNNEETYAKAAEVVRKTEPERYERICRIKDGDNKLRALSAGMLIKDVCDKCGIKDPVICRDEHGKPYIEGHPEVFFNLSHSGKFVAMAYGDRPVGIDIQETRNVTESFAKRILNGSEIDKCDLSDIKTICRLWTIKEAYSKLTGLGLSYDFRDCIIDTEEKTVTDTTGKYGRALYRSFRPQGNVYMSYAVYTDDKEQL